MSVTIDATVGGTASNSFQTVSEADAFWTGHYSAVKAAAWAALTPDQKASVLVDAAQVLETLRVLDTEYGAGKLPYALITRDLSVITISPLMPGQRLQFPRNIDIDYNTGEAFIPDAVKAAQNEQAIYLLTYDQSPVATMLSGVVNQSIAAGSARITQSFIQGGSSLAPLALDKMRPFLRPTNRFKRA